jgi:outer membrane receptor protein involved in Fe transport
VQIYGQNLTNVTSSLNTSAYLSYISEVPQRPRVLGLRMTYKFSEK